MENWGTQWRNCWKLSHDRSQWQQICRHPMSWQIHKCEAGVSGEGLSWSEHRSVLSQQCVSHVGWTLLQQCSMFIRWPNNFVRRHTDLMSCSAQVWGVAPRTVPWSTPVPVSTPTAVCPPVMASLPLKTLAALLTDPVMWGAGTVTLMLTVLVTWSVVWITARGTSTLVQELTRRSKHLLMRV